MEDILVFMQDQVLLVAALAILIGLLIRKESSAAGTKLSLNQVIQALNSESSILIDVRESKDFDKGHVTNAINVPHNKVASSLSILEKYKDKQIIVTDAMGQHSGSVSRELIKEGYDVARMGGGMSEWQQEGLPLVK